VVVLVMMVAVLVMMVAVLVKYPCGVIFTCMGLRMLLIGQFWRVARACK
jgi:hypothetical protein